jgi:hypothetical protein
VTLPGEPIDGPAAKRSDDVMLAVRAGRLFDGDAVEPVEKPLVLIFIRRRRPLPLSTLARVTLEQAVETLYTTFAGYPLRDWTDPCPHCHSRECEQKIRRVPLRDLTDEDLSEFVADSLTLWGNLDDLKHFLPRILEIAALEGFDFPDLEIVYGHLGLGKLATWPEPERAAVRAFLMAHLRADLAEGVHQVYYFDPVLTGIMLIEDDITPYLSWWEQSDDPATLENLAEYANEVGRILRGERRWNAFLGRDDSPLPPFRVPPGPGQAVAWLTSPRLLTSLMSRRGTLPGPDAETALTRALAAIGELQSSS